MLKKTLFGLSAIIITLIFFIANAYTFSAPNIRVIDAITKLPIKNVEVFFYYNSCPGPEDMRHQGDPYTCYGEYKKIQPHKTNENGEIFFKNKLYIIGKPTVRFNVQVPENYISTRSYELGHHDVVRLIPKNAPLNSKVKAIEYLSKKNSFQIIIKYFESLGMNSNYLYIEKEAFYGVWRTTINLSPKNKKYPPDSLVVLVHPDGEKYIICNPKRKNKEGYWLRRHSFLKGFDNAISYPFRTNGCDPELLF